MIIVVALIIGALLGVGMAINGNRKRRDKRDAMRYLAEKARAEKQTKP